MVAYSEKEYNDLPELYDTIDSEALNRIFRSWNDPDVELTFRYAGNLITVYGTGKIVVRNSDSLTRYPDRD